MNFLCQISLIESSSWSEVLLNFSFIALDCFFIVNCLSFGLQVLRMKTSSSTSNAMYNLEFFERLKASDLKFSCFQLENFKRRIKGRLQFDSNTHSFEPKTISEQLYDLLCVFLSLAIGPVTRIWSCSSSFQTLKPNLRLSS